MENFILGVVAITIVLHLKYEESIFPYFSITTVATLICHIMNMHVLILALCILFNVVAFCNDVKNIIISFKKYVA